MARAELKLQFIIGIDEVGRGALAGPVVVAVAILQKGIGIGGERLGKLKDSKKLSARKRELWYAHFLVHPAISFAIARVYPRQIEKQNISKAANLAALRAYDRILKSMDPRLREDDNKKIFLDGGLYLGNGKKRKINSLRARTVIKGDEKINAVKIASIIAKVHRDRFMKKIAKKYPVYGFEIHKGYGTEAHCAAIKKYGICEAHRLTFMRPGTRI